MPTAPGLLDTLKQTLQSLMVPASLTPLAAIADEWGTVTVLEDAECRVLRFDEVFEQSKMRRSAPFEPVFNYSKVMLFAAMFRPCRNALILGLGGGSLVRSLQHMDAQLQLTAVDNRAAVLELARQYFLIEPSPTLTLHCQDAVSYLQQASCVDLIFADLYIAMQMAESQRQSSFVELCLQRLNPGGWLAINYERHQDVDDKLLRVLYRAVDDVYWCAIPHGNAVVLAGRVDPQIGMAAFAKQLPDAERLLGCDLQHLAQRLQRLPNPSSE